jgi:hypothetical protein
MAQTYKAKLLSGFFAAILAVVFLIPAGFLNPAKVFAQNTCSPDIDDASKCATFGGEWDGQCVCPNTAVRGDSCAENPDVCEAGLECDPVSKLCLIPDGNDCPTSRYCLSGSSCVQNKCVKDSGSGGNGNGNGGGGNTDGTGGGGTGSNPVGVGSTELVCKNGVCLPADQQCKPGSLSGACNLTELIILVIKLLLGLSGVVAVLFVILGGYWYMASGGNEEQAEKGKKTITNFVLGFVIIILAYTIVTIVTNTLINTP